MIPLAMGHWSQQDNSGICSVSHGAPMDLSVTHIVFFSCSRSTMINVGFTEIPAGSFSHLHLLQFLWVKSALFFTSEELRSTLRKKYHYAYGSLFNNKIDTSLLFTELYRNLHRYLQSCCKCIPLSLCLYRLLNSNTFTLIANDAFAGLTHLQYLWVPQFLVPHLTFLTLLLTTAQQCPSL